ncbi:MAG: hypothetical protein H6736_11150, partial [Alphaproteobacteria bacterium]|nr:hypothetical protein [Alphaproteobacteria bacterium]
MRPGRGALLLLSLLAGCARGPRETCAERDRIPFFADDDGDGFGDPDRYILECEAFPGFVRDATDCDDGNAAVYPFALEVCDRIDNDCDRSIDEGWPYGEQFLDADGDGFGDGWTRTTSCEPLPGHVPVAGDCDDDDPARYPGAPERCEGGDRDCDGLTGDDEPDLLDGEGTVTYADRDGDGYGAPGSAERACVPEVGRVLDATDCDDLNPWVHPDALEVCNGLDDDCDLLTDDSDPSVDTLTQRTWFLDADQDGLGDLAVSLQTCTEPWYWVLNALDCDDSSAEVGSVNAMRWREDLDGDGVGAGPPTAVTCAPPGPAWVPADRGVDCDDADPARAPGLPEICDGFDDDCDGLVDDEDVLDPSGALAFFVDADGDGFGGELALACAVPDGAVDVSGDCDDTDAFVFPGASELCNFVDDDCDGLVDDADPDRNALWGMNVFRDRDGDGFGDPFTASRTCRVPAGWSANAGDCDDTNPALGPPAMWWPDGDGDRFGSGAIVGPSCAPPGPGYVVEGEVDCDDGDPVVKPGAFELCEDGVDQDCDGTDAPCPRGSCLQILDDGLSVGDGVYGIAPGGGPVVDVWCDMTTDGGGWTLVSASNTPVDDAADDYSDTL